MADSSPAAWATAGTRSHTAAPARAVALAGLPPAYVLAAGMDCLRDEAVNYAMAMARGGVEVELHLVPAVPHGFDAVAPSAAVSQRVIAEYAAALRHGLGEPDIGSRRPASAACGADDDI